jgi:TolA-binding protein
MIDAHLITRTHDQATVQWHDHGSHFSTMDPPAEDAPTEAVVTSDRLMAFILAQHRANFDLWHQEDLARDMGATAENIATVKHYESALRLMQEGKYEKAHAAFNQMLAASPADLAERIRMYINACLQQISKGKTSSTSHEERYDYAISLLNDGHYEDARDPVQKIIAENEAPTTPSTASPSSPA